MASIALVCTLVLFAVAVFVRMFIQHRMSGKTGLVTLVRTRTDAFIVSVIAASFVCFAVAIARGRNPGWPMLAAGLAVFAVGLVCTVWCQLAMGSSWRIGVNPSETTTLVVGGPFRWVRNPIFSAMLIAVAGLALLTDHPLAWLAAAGLFTAIELQVRLSEEPYLLRTHGAAYRDYAARTGRFLPFIGRGIRSGDL